MEDKSLDEHHEAVQAHKATVLTDAPCGLAKCKAIVLDLFAAYDAEREARVKAEEDLEKARESIRAWIRRYGEEPIR